MLYLDQNCINVTTIALYTNLYFLIVALLLRTTCCISKITVTPVGTFFLCSQLIATCQVLLKRGSLDLGLEFFAHKACSVDGKIGWVKDLTWLTNLHSSFRSRKFLLLWRWWRIWTIERAKLLSLVLRVMQTADTLLLLTKNCQNKSDVSHDHYEKRNDWIYTWGCQRTSASTKHS